MNTQNETLQALRKLVESSKSDKSVVLIQKTLNLVKQYKANLNSQVETLILMEYGLKQEIKKRR